MKIEKYEFTKKNKYNVYLSNGEVLTLNEKVITENELLLKKEIDNELYKKINHENKIYELEIIAIKYIDIRLRSIKEIENYLIRKEATKEEIIEVVKNLEKKDYLNDERFTKAFIKDKLNFTSMGDYKIKMELLKLGVNENIINNNINDIDENIIKDKITKSIEKEIKINKKYSGNILRNKIYNHLVNQGYSKKIIIEVINNYNF